MQAQDKERPDEYSFEQLKKEAAKLLDEGKFDEYMQLAGSAGRIYCLSVSYCSNSTLPIKLEPNADWFIFPGTERLEWSFTVNDVLVPGVVSTVGVGMAAEHYFHPDLVPAEFLGRLMTVAITQYDAIGPVTNLTDYTNVQPAPKIIDVVFDDSSLYKQICQGESASIVLNNIQAGVRYDLNRNGTFVALKDGLDGEDLIFNVNIAGTYTVKAINLVSLCEEDMRGAIELVINPKPVPTINSNSPVCEGESIMLNGGPGGMASYTWSGPGITGTETGQNINIPNALNATHQGTYTLEIVDANGCANIETKLVTVNINPEVSITGDSGPFCEGENVTYTAVPSKGVAPYSYQWYKNGVEIVGATNQTLTFNPIVAADADDYSVIVKDSKNCGSAEEFITIEVNTKPAIAPIVYSGDDCAGEELSFETSASGGTGNYVYIWMLDGVQEANSTNELKLSSIPAGNHTITVQVADGACYSDIETLNFSVLAKPVAQLTGSDVCVGSSVTFDASGSSDTDTYVFRIDGAVVQSSASSTYTYNPGVADVGVREIKVIAKNGNGCEDETSIEIEVFNLPVATISLADSDICNGGSTDLIFELTTGVTPWNLVYSDGVNNFNINNIGNVTHSVSVNPASNTTYSLVSIVDSESCASTPLGVNTTLIVKPTPTVSISGNSEVCLGKELKLVANPAGGSGTYLQYKWEKDGVVLGESSDTYTVPSATLLDAGQYFVTVYDNTNCENISSGFDVVVNQAVATLLVNDTEVCEGDLVTFTAGGAGTGTYEFFLNNISVQGPGANNIYTTSTLTDGDRVSVEIIDGKGCDDNSGDITMTVYPTPTATIALADTDICDGDFTNLIFELTTGVTPWNLVYSDGVNNFNENNIATATHLVSVTPNAATTYELVSIKDSKDCEVLGIGSTVTLIVNTNPTVSISGNAEVCFDKELKLVANPAGGSGNYVQYKWEKDGVDLGESSDTYTVLNATLADAGKYTVTVFDDNDCKSESLGFDVTVNQAVATLVVNDTEVCEGDLVTFTAGGAGTGTYEFFLNNIPVQGPDANNIYTTSTLVDGDRVSVQIIDGKGCDANSGDITMTVYPTPTATITLDDTDICDGDSTNLVFELTTGVTPWELTYSDGINTYLEQNVLTPRFSILVDPTSTTTYELVSIKDFKGCEALAIGSTATLIVNPNPTVSIVGNTAVCSGETLNINAVALGGSGNYVQYSWTKDGVDLGINVDSYFVLTATGADAGKYVVTVFDDNGCNAVSDTFKIDVSSATASLTATPMCKEVSSIDFIASGAGGGTYQFSVNGVVTQSASAVSVFTYYAKQNGDFILVEIVDDNGCEDSKSAIVSLLNSPIVTLMASETEICEGEAITFTAGGADFYEFFIDGVSVQGPSSDNEYITNTLLNGQTLLVKGEDANSCTNTEQVVITVYDIPTVTLVANPSSNVMLGTDIEFVASGADRYEFYLNDVAVQAMSVDDSWTLIDPQNGDKITVIGVANGCSNSDEIIVTVDVMPVEYELLPLYSEYCAGDGGVTLYLDNFDAGVKYELIENSSGVEVLFGDGAINLLNGRMSWYGVTQGEYFVRATSLLGVAPSVDFNTVVTVVENISPTIFDVIPNSTFVSCSVDDIVDFELSGSQVDIEYFVYVDGEPLSLYPIIGDGNPINFGRYNVHGTYTVIAVDPNSGCSISMNGAMILDFGAANKYNLTTVNGNLSEMYCTDGVKLKLDGSDNGAVYVLWKDGVPITTNSLSGTGNEIITEYLSEGVYRISLISGECFYWMNNSVIITKDQGVSDVFLSADNGGKYCKEDLVAGAQLYIDNQEADVEYTLYDDNDNLISTINVSGVDLVGPIAFPDLVDQIGTYSLYGGRIGGCDPILLDEIDIEYDAVPNTPDLSVVGNLCGGTGYATILIKKSDANVEYSLYYEDDSFELALNGDGGSLSFYVSKAGEYYVYSKFTDGTSNCISEKSNVVEIEDFPFPDKDKTYNHISAVGCGGDSLSIISPDVGVKYELYFLPEDEINFDKSISTGNKADDDTGVFAEIIGNGKYLIYATNEDGCGAFLEDSSDPNAYPIEIKNVSVPNVYNIIASSSICEGEIGNLRLSGYQNDDIDYILYRTAIDENDNLVGISNPIDTIRGSAVSVSGFDILQDGHYTVIAENTLGDNCSAEMIGGKPIRFNKLPKSFKMIGSGYYCDGAGAVIGLEGSEPNVIYTIIGSDGTIYDIKEGNLDGSELYFDKIPEELTFRVNAKNTLTGCTSSMEGNITVEEKLESPDIDKDVKIMPENGVYCSNESVVSVTISDVDAGITYSLIDISTGVIESSKIAKVGQNQVVLSAIDLSDNSSGTQYKLVASYADRGCEAVFNIDTIRSIRLDAPPKPVVNTPTKMENKVCPKDSYLEFEVEPDVQYVIYLDGDTLSTISSPVAIYDQQIKINESGFVYIEASYNSGCPVVSNMYYFNLYTTAGDFTITVDNSGYHCEGTLGVDLIVNGTELGIYYELYRENEEDPIALTKGDGNDKVFYSLFGSPEGVNYTVKADAEGECGSDDLEGIIVTIYEVPLPDTPKNLFTEIIGMGETRVVLIDAEKPSLRDTISYQPQVDLEKEGEPNVLKDTIWSKGDVENLLLGVYTESGIVDIVATRHLWDTSGNELIECASQPFGGARIGERLLQAKDFYMYVQVGRNSVATELGKYVLPDESKLSRDKLKFTLELIDASVDEDHELMWVPADGLESGTNLDKVNLVKSDDTGNILGEIMIHNGDSITFARKTGNLYGIVKVQYKVELKGTDQYDIGTITLIIGNAEGVDGTTFILPNAFSPNGDGINDRFVIDGLQNFLDNDTKPLSVLEVFNRWGTLVYKSKGLRYGIDSEWWDGKSNTGNMVSIGKELPIGTYYYILTVSFIKFDDDGKEVKVRKEFPGFIELRK